MLRELPSCGASRHTEGMTVAGRPVVSVQKSGSADSSGERSTKNLGSLSSNVARPRPLNQVSNEGRGGARNGQAGPSGNRLL